MAKGKKKVTDIKKARARKAAKRGGYQITMIGDLATQDILQLNANVDICLAEPEKLSRPFWQWCNFIRNKIEKTVKEYRKAAAAIPGHDDYQNELRKVPVGVSPQETERMLKSKFPKYFAAIEKLWNEPAEIEIEAARIDWLEFCQPQPGISGLLSQGMFDNPEVMLDLIYKD